MKQKRSLLSIHLILACLGNAPVEASSDDFALLISPPVATLATVGGSANLEVVLKTEINGVAGWSFGVVLVPDADVTAAMTNLQADAIIQELRNGLPADYQAVTWYNRGSLSLPAGFCEPVCADTPDGIAFTMVILIDHQSIVTLPMAPDGIVVAAMTVHAAGPVDSQVNVKFSNLVGDPRVDTVVLQGVVSYDPAVKRAAQIVFGADPSFIRGDANDDGAVNIADAIYILQNLFAGGPLIPCPDAADANDDEAVNLADAIYLLQKLFAGGPAIPPPHPACGTDTTAGALDLPPCEYSQENCTATVEP